MGRLFVLDTLGMMGKRKLARGLFLTLWLHPAQGNHAHDSPSLLGWAQVGISNLPYHAPARLCVAGIVASHMCQCGGGLWLFDTALGKVVHPRSVRGILEQHVNLIMSRA